MVRGVLYLPGDTILRSTKDWLKYFFVSELLSDEKMYDIRYVNNND